MPLDINAERKRIAALFQGDPRANFANYVQPEQQESTLPATAGNDVRKGEASSSVIVQTPYKTDVNKGPSLNYQQALRQRLGSIQSMSDNPTLRAMQAAQARQQAQQGNILGNTPTPGNWSAAGVTDSKRRQAVLQAAASQAGMPYSWGGGNYSGATEGGSNTRTLRGGPVGFDCSGLVQYAYAQVGIKLPRHNTAQLAMGVRTPISKLQPGDLVGSSGHIAIYAGNGMMWEAPTFGKSVRLAPVRPGMFGVHLSY